jgi:F-type H+-transporting ATPase subunit epsilon
MAGNINLEIVTPDKAVANEEASIVMAPGELGEFGILIGHTPFLAALKIGAVRYVDSTGTEKFVFVNGGFAEALPDKVTILAESAERQEDVNIDRAKASMERARERLADQTHKDETDFVRARISLERAIQRLNMVNG